jgi:heme-degrading monooxygenase HmoA
MYARVSTGQTQPGNYDRLMSIWRDEVIPLIRQQRGFKGVIVFGDREANSGGSITLWETEADAQASMASDTMRQALAALAPVLAGQPTMQNHEVSILDIVYSEAQVYP